ncbi:MAG: hemerythrin domain-containing protein [Thermodesulfobacteriota bacterium]
MEEYLTKGIKEIIQQFPSVGSILDEYGIGCGPCSVGICQLKDIVGIHHLPKDQEDELMSRIAAAVNPDVGITPCEQRKKTRPQEKKINYSPPLQQLVDEHVWIKRWIALIPELVRRLDLESRDGREIILAGLDMIRSYADKLHHAKEEDILFKYFDETADIIKVMLEDHQKARSLVRAMMEALDKPDKDAIGTHLLAYRELLSEHIRKEDEILYPWMDSRLSMHQVGELFSKFADSQMGFSPEKYQTFILDLEERFNKGIL